jgi:hypothetical protein
MRAYKHSNKRIQYRDSKGKFTTPCLDAECCPNCRAVILPEGVRFNKRYPSECHQCGTALDFKI